MRNKLLLFLLLAAAGLSANAQDKIYKRDGDVVDAKIKEVGSSTVSYKRFENLTGPDYSIDKSDVEKIKYQNGTEDVFEESRSRMFPPMPGMFRRRPHTASKINYNENIIALAPFQFSDRGLGLGISYERTLDKNGIISFVLPVAFIFNVNGNRYDSYSGTYNNNNNSDNVFYAMPGFKFYPTGNKGIVKYAIGPAFVVATGQQTDYYDIYGTAPYTTEREHFEFGFLINNYLNINPTPHLFLSLELGLGSTYINTLDGVRQAQAFMGQGAFKIGYRF